MLSNRSIDRQKAAAFEYYNQGEYEKALNEYRNIEEILPDDAIDDQIDITKMEGNCYLQIGKWNESFRVFRIALKLALIVNSEKHLGSLYNHVANYYRHNERFDECLKYIAKGIQISKKNKDDITLGKLYNTKGVLMHARGQYGEALINITNSIQLFEKMNDSIPQKKFELLKSRSLLGALYVDRRDEGDLQRAKSLLETTITEAKHLENKERVSFCTIKLALIDFLEGRLGDAKTKLIGIVGQDYTNIRDIRLENQRVALEACYIMACIFRNENDFKGSGAFFDVVEKSAFENQDKVWMVKAILEKWASAIVDAKPIPFESILDVEVKDMFFSAEYLFVFGRLTSSLLLNTWVNMDYGSLLNQYTKAIEKMLDSQLLKPFRATCKIKTVNPNEDTLKHYRNIVGSQHTTNLTSWDYILQNIEVRSDEPIVNKLNDFLFERFPDIAKLQRILGFLKTHLQEIRNDGTHQELMSLKECLDVREKCINEINQLIMIVYSTKDGLHA